MDNVREMGKYTNITTAFAIPDSVGPKETINAHIVVGTPGTVQNFMKRRQLDTRNVKIFVLDEADNMLDQQGLGDTSLRIKNMMPKDCQFVLFSATFTDEVRDYSQKVVPNANILTLAKDEVAVDTIKQFYMDCKSEEHKAEVLSAIYGLLTIGQSIIFARRKDTVDHLAQKMTSEGHQVTVLHGNQTPQERDKSIDDFREGRSKVLLTTNVIARGIDILQVNLVINYDIPLTKDHQPDVETYIHRIGRTGRFGRQGVSINFVHDDRSMREMESISKAIHKEITRVPTDSYQEIETALKKAV
ncbi:P-loop containing nucleoside triphosphate hydrolase protein, partial [Gorgonomyces haynaldii]